MVNSERGSPEFFQISRFMVKGRCEDFFLGWQGASRFEG